MLAVKIPSINVFFLKKKNITGLFLDSVYGRETRKAKIRD